jgi:hypothetical protein
MDLSRRRFLKECVKGIVYIWSIDRFMDLGLQVDNLQLKITPLFDPQYTYCSEVVEKAIENKK